MKVSELRIGNYYYDDNNNPAKVDRNFFSVYEYDMPNAIPLTEEWLLKFGFDYDKFEKSYTKDFVAFSLLFSSDMDMYFHDGRDWNSKLNGKIKYVHQLQNLYFVLTGEELHLEKQVSL